MLSTRSGGDGPGFRVRATLVPRLVAVFTALMLIVGGLAAVPDMVMADAGGDTTVTTDDLKLRAAPATNAEILTVIPAGGTVAITGSAENGFYPVSYNGQDGYAYGAYLSGFAADGPVTTGGQQGEVNVVDGPVNHRSGPSTDDPVLAVIPDGAVVALNGDSANGFVAVLYNDQSGWADAASVFGSGEEAAPPAEEAEEDDTSEPETQSPSVPVGDEVTGQATVFDGGLNLRTGPGTEYDIVLVMPDGAAVDLRGDGQNGFLPVSYNGTTGWASAEWLKVGGDEPVEETPAPTAPPVDGSEAYTDDEIIQIIHAAADQYGQNRDDMLRVARCESVLDPNAVNSSSQASGLFQFLPSTWASTPFADQDIFDPVANAEAAAWMWANGRRGEWTCQ